MKKLTIDSGTNIQALVLERGHNIYIPESNLAVIFKQIAESLCDDTECKAREDLQGFLQSIAMSVDPVEKDGTKFYRLDRVYYFFDNWRKAIEKNDPEFLFRRRGLRHPQIGFEEFATSQEYGAKSIALRPGVLRVLRDLHSRENIIEVCLDGSTGWGKTFCAISSVFYDLYKLSCYDTPQVEFGLSPGTGIVYLLQSVSESHAKKTLMEPLREMISSSPYFQEHFPLDKKIKSEIVLPKNVSVMAVSGSETAVLSLNCLGALVDEMNFLSVTKGTYMSKLRGEERSDKAMKLYTTLLRRMKGRFIQRGGHLPGKIYLVSSANYPGDFTSRKREEALDDPTIFCAGMAQWEAFRRDDGKLDPEKYCGQTFKIFVGSTYEPPRIIEDDSEIEGIDPEKIIEPPIEYQRDFELDPDNALRDIGGVPRTRRNKFIPSDSWITKSFKLFEAVTGSEKQLFVDHVGIDLAKYPEDSLEKLLNMDYLKAARDKTLSPQFIKKVPRFAVHIDIGISGDSAALSVGRVIALSKNSVFSPYMPQTADFVTKGNIKAPVIMIDGILRLIPTAEADIDIDKIQAIIFMLLKLGLPIHWVTGDQFQSAQLLRNVSKVKGVRSGVLSMDKTIGPYMNLKNSLRDMLVAMPPHPVLFDELSNLELDRKRGTHGKIDHPDKLTGKDVSDAVCGVHQRLILTRQTYEGGECNEIDLEDVLNGVVINDNESPEPVDTRSEWERTLDKFTEHKKKERELAEQNSLGRVQRQQEMEKQGRRGRRTVSRIRGRLI